MCKKLLLVIALIFGALVSGESQARASSPYDSDAYIYLLRGYSYAWTAYNDHPTNNDAYLAYYNGYYAAYYASLADLQDMNSWYFPCWYFAEYYANRAAFYSYYAYIELGDAYAYEAYWYFYVGADYAYYANLYSN